MNKISRLKHDVIKEMKENKRSFFVYLLLRFLVLLTLVLQLFNHNYENVFLCILTLLLLVVPSLLQVTFKIDLPETLEIILLLFVFAAEILGEIKSFYLIFPYFDTLLHTLNGFLAAAIGFSLVDIMNKDERLTFQMSPLFMAIVSFSFSMTIGVCWEIFEYMMDSIFLLDMQKDTIIHTISSVSLDATMSNTAIVIDNIKNVTINGNNLNISGYLDIGLIDTMNDLIVNFIGAVVFSLFGFVYIKNKGKGKLVTKLIPFKKGIKKERID